MPTRFEEIKVGDKSEFERGITAEDIDLFAKITGDFNSLHMDDGLPEGRVSEGGSRMVCSRRLLSAES